VSSNRVLATAALVAATAGVLITAGSAHETPSVRVKALLAKPIVARPRVAGHSLAPRRHRVDARRAQATASHRIPPSMGVGALRPGDLVFWAHDPHDLSTVHHVAIYLGGGKVLQSPESGEVVKISPLWMTGCAGAARLD
jgi:hypothetical protein